MQQGYKQILLDEIFSKGILQSRGQYTAPYQFSPDARNIRLFNGNTTIRKWYRTVISWPVEWGAKNVQWIGKLRQTLLLAKNNKLYVSPFSADWVVTTLIEIGTLNGTSQKQEFISSSYYSIICNWVGWPSVFNASTWSLSYLSPWTHLPAGAKPAYWVVFANMSIIWWTADPYNDWLAASTLYLSAWVTISAPQNIYDYTGSWSEQLIMKSPVLGIVENQEQVFIFCDHGVEYLSRDTITTLWWVATSYTVPWPRNRKPASHRSIVVADNAVFFLSKDKTLCSIWFTPWITSAELGEILEEANQTFRSFFDTLDDDQSRCCSVYNDQENTVEWHVKQKWYLFNNATVVFDLVNKTVFVDEGKNYSCLVNMSNHIYAGSDLNTTLFEDNVNRDDDGKPIKRYRRTKPLSFWNQNIRKYFGEIGLVGQCNYWADINIKVLLDWSTQYEGWFEWDVQDGRWRWSEMTWWLTIAWEWGENKVNDFEKVLSKGAYYDTNKGKKLQIKLYGDNIWADVVLSTMYISVKALWDVNLNDKID